MKKYYVYQQTLMRLILVVVISGLFAFSAVGQQVITGKVTSLEDGSVMPGVNVVVKGSQVGTASNAADVMVCAYATPVNHKNAHLKNFNSLFPKFDSNAIA